LNIHLSSPYLDFTFDLQTGAWSLRDCEGRLALKEAHSRATWKGAWRTTNSFQSLGAAQLQTPHGPAQSITLMVGGERAPVQQRLVFALPHQVPLLLIQMELENQGHIPVYLDRFQFLTSDRSSSLRTAGLEPDSFFSNGWQSWNFSGAYGAQDRFQRTRLGFLTEPMRINPGTPHPKQQGSFSSDMFGVLTGRRSRRGLLAGFLSQQQGFGSLACRLEGDSTHLSLWSNGDGARLDPGQRYTTDWACLQFIDLDQPDPLGIYLEAAAREHGLEPARQQCVPRGWCSWYHYYSDLNAQDVRANLQAASRLRPELPLELIQIDDGFESAVGDWFSFKSSFPHGVAPLAQEILQAGFIPGLWLAPFTVQRGSHLAHDHPDWLLRRRGRLANAGFIFNAPFGASLDLTHPQALDYVAEVIHTAVHEWAFPYLKLDFLYTAALGGRYADPTRTRAQVLRRGLETIRHAAGPQTFILGCGCPLGPAIGLVDAMRIGADVAERWAPAHFGTEVFFTGEPDMPSTRNAIQNALTRSPLHQRWWINDPDVLLARPETHLSLAEVQSLASVLGMSGGSLFLSDDLSALPPDRLWIAISLLPPTGKRPQVLDLFDRQTPTRLRLDLENQTGAWHCLALFNWEDQPADLVLRPADFGLDAQKIYLGREFWSGRGVCLGPEGQRFPAVPAHGAVLAAVRAVSPAAPAYLGSDLHFSQGLEVYGWHSQPGTVEIELARPGQAAGEIELYLPRSPILAALNGRELSWSASWDGRFRFPIIFSDRASIRILTRRD
jgi:alpha-galactosidase